MTAIADKNPGTSQKTGSVNEFEAVQSLLKSESTAVDQLILHRLSSDVVLINQLGV